VQPAARHIVHTTDGTAWHNAGVWKPTAVADGDRLAVFFTVAERLDNPYVPASGVGGISFRLLGAEMSGRCPRQGVFP
jgi:hypothetical protein